MRVKTHILSVGAVIVGLASLTGSAQSVGYTLVPGWLKMPPGMYFGKKEGVPTTPPSPEAAAAANRARGGVPPSEGNGLGGIAIDDQDRIYAFNRGAKTVIVFDRDGNFVKAAGGGPLNGVPMDAAGSHSGNVDWQGNVWVVDRERHRVVKLDSTLEKAVLQIGVTNVSGVGPDHLNRPSGIAFTRAGNIIVTDGYGNNRVMLYTKDGKFIKQAAKGAGGPTDKGKGPGEFDDPHEAAVDALDRIYIGDRGNARVVVLDNQLNFVQEFKFPGTSIWHISVSRKGNEGTAFIADKITETIWKFSTKDGSVITKFGKPGRNPGEFDGAHSIMIDTRGALYISDTNGQRLQKFVPTPAGR